MKVTTWSSMTPLPTLINHIWLAVGSIQNRCLFSRNYGKRPILVTPKFTLVTRFDDVREVLNMPKVFTVEPYVSKMGDYLMMHYYDALHTREKSLM